MSLQYKINYKDMEVYKLIINQYRNINLRKKLKLKVN